MVRVLALFLTGVLALPAVAQEKGYSALVAKVKSEVTKDFRDPEGARFREMALFKTKTGKTGNFVCGQVNAKNAYGAYVGYRNFVYSDGLVAIDSEEDAVKYGILSEAICHERLRSLS